jgi:Na+/melibiose symporter-like transporter
MNPPKALLASDMQPALLAWLAATVVIVSLANSAAQLAHQSWAISRGKSLRQQARLIGWREGLTLLGVMVASVLAAQALVLPMTVGVIGVGLVALVVLIRLRPGHSLAARAQAATAPSTFGDWLDQLFSGYRQVFHPRYKQLLLALGINALANAIPASLFLFYVRDVLKLTDLMAGLLLLAYFSTAALSIPAWGWLMGRFGPRQCWRLAMLGSILAFFWATFLGSGDALGFGVICLVTGFALGAELIAPSLFIGRIIEEAGHREALEGQYFGLWNLLAKSALAAAAGLVLPALALTGYDPSAAIAQGTALVKEMAAGITVSSLSLFYAGLPCLLKLIALGLIPAFNKEPSDALSHPVAHHPAR